MQNLIPINLVIGDRSYRIKIEAGDEEMVRKTAKKLNDRLSQFKSQYAGKDMQDYLAMVLLSVVTEDKPVVNEDKRKEQVADTTPTKAALERFEALIDRALED
jgi:cell division protein ZapA (FtsZ GTPase activity inhibitor)